jgi:hypothetical protein
MTEKDALQNLDTEQMESFSTTAQRHIGRVQNATKNDSPLAQKGFFSIRPFEYLV